MKQNDHAPKPLNHACFESAMADILSKAYQAFPSPIEVLYSDDFQAAKAAGKIPDHCPERFDVCHTLYGSTLDFLLREGLLVAGEKTPFCASEVVLTSKGFIILNKPLESLASGDKPTIGQHLERAGKRAGTDLLSSVISQTVGMLVASVAK